MNSALVNRVNAPVWSPGDFRICTTLTHTNYVFDDFHLRALYLFACVGLGILTIMLWRKYRKEDDE